MQRALVSLMLFPALGGCVVREAAQSSTAAAGLERCEYAAPAMGTEFRLVLYAADRAQADAAAAAAFARISELDRALSDYDPSSELSRLAAQSDERAPTGALALSDDLCRVLAAAEDVARASDGAFDVTVGPLVRLWRRARRQEELPEPARVAAARAAIGYQKLELDRAARTARLLVPGMRLDLGGIAKGFALDEARSVLAARGIERVLLVGGGDVLAGAPPPGQAGWRVAITGLDGSDPRRDRAGAELELACAALSTSGDLVRSIVLDGVRYSHILDPRSGAALTERRLVSVRAPSGTLADAWATALSVLGPPGLARLGPASGIAARIALAAADGVELFESEGFPPALSCAPSAPRAGSNP